MIYRCLRDLIQRLGITIQQEANQERLQIKVARTLYHGNDSDGDLAIDKIAVLERTGTSSVTQSSLRPSQNGKLASMTSGTIRSGEFADSRMVHNVSMRIKDQQYGGLTTESLIETINLCTRVVSD
jgi:hypothetical protein